MLDSILRELYRGRIHPEEEYQPAEEIRRERKKLDMHRRAMLEDAQQLESDLGRRLLALFETENMIDGMEMEEVYIQGMRMGAKLALELMRDT